MYIQPSSSTNVADHGGIVCRDLLCLSLGSNMESESSKWGTLLHKFHYGNLICHHKLRIEMYKLVLPNSKSLFCPLMLCHQLSSALNEV